MAATLEIETKRGDTFELVLEYAPDDVPFDLTGATVESKLRHLDFEQSLTVTLADQTLYPGRVTLSCAYATTASWPLEKLLGDVQVTIGGVRRSSRDFVVDVREDRT
jgi:hypothetical protein